VRILLLTHAFNSLAQRLFVALGERGHEVSVEFDINDRVTEEAVALFRPDVVVAPFLKRAIPESVWRSTVCLIVHPGIKGDRGPSALDWAILDGEAEWGVTVLQADAEMDAGDESTVAAKLAHSKYAHEFQQLFGATVFVARPDTATDAAGNTIGPYVKKPDN